MPLKHSLEVLATTKAQTLTEQDLLEEIAAQETTYRRLQKLTNQPLVKRWFRKTTNQRLQEHKKLHLQLYANKAAHAKQTGDQTKYNNYIQEALNYQHV